MCVRYVRESDARQIARTFEAVLTFDPASLHLATYNIAPSQAAWVVRQGPVEREVVSLRWGLVPPWAKDPAAGHRMINARAETVASRPAYRGAFRHRRCLVPATGFYEWAKTASGKQPYLVRMVKKPLFAFAGLWEHWQSPEGSELETFTIITTDANAKVQHVHDRMPVMLSPEQAGQWLEADAEGGKLQELLKTPPDDAITLQAVSRVVNSPANDSPACVEPADDGSADTLWGGQG